MTPAERAARARASADRVVEHLQGDHLRSVLLKAALRGLEAGHAIAMGATGASRQFNPDDPAMKRILDDVGDRITGIVDTTREKVRGYVELVVDREGSVNDIVTLLRADPSGAFSPARARMIARTESTNVLNRGSVAGYRASGRVSRVEVLDGPGCSWPEGHGDGDEANGMVVTLEEAEQYPSAHPHCVRAFSPIIDAETTGEE